MKNLITKKILREFRTYFDGMFFLRRISLRALKKYFYGNLLEIGVGYGPDIDFLKNLKSVKKYTGVDRQEFFSTYSDKKLNRNKNIIYYKGERLPFKAGSFDTIVSFDCLEHIRYKSVNIFFREIRRVLKENGNFILSVPFIYPEHSQVFDYYRFTRFGLEDLATFFGFKITLMKARSSSLETILVLLNHRLFFYFFPKVISSEFSKGTKSVFFVKELSKWIAFPFFASVYIFLSFFMMFVSVFTRDRMNSPLNLGYSCILKKDLRRRR